MVSPRLASVSVSVQVKTIVLLASQVIGTYAGVVDIDGYEYVGVSVRLGRLGRSVVASRFRIFSFFLFSLSFAAALRSAASAKALSSLRFNSPSGLLATPSSMAGWCHRCLRPMLPPLHEILGPPAETMARSTQPSFIEGKLKWT